MNKDTMLKEFALGQWLSFYESSKVNEIFDELMDCPNEDTYFDIINKYELTEWELVESAYWEYTVEQIRNTYSSLCSLIESLEKLNETK